MGNGAASHAKLCPRCFDLREGSSSSSSSPSSRHPSCDEELVHYRPATMRGWLTHWELASLEPTLASFGFETPAQVRLLTAEHHRRVMEVLNSKLHLAWNRAVEHIQHLQESTPQMFHTSGGLASLRIWLEAHRLARLLKEFEGSWSCKTKDDVAHCPGTSEAAVKLGMLPLEVRRWQRARTVLRDGMESNQDAGGRATPSKPSLVTWLRSFELTSFMEVFNDLGAEQVSDVIALDLAFLKTLGFTKRDLNCWHRAVAAVSQATRGHQPNTTTSTTTISRCGDVVVEHASLRSWLMSYNLERLEEALTELGAAAPIDLLDLTSKETSALVMRPLELKRWKRQIKWLESCALSSSFSCTAAVLPSTDSQSYSELVDPNSLLYFVQEGLAGIEPRAEDDEAQALPGLRPPPAMTQSTLGALLVERILGSAPEFQKAAMSGIWSEAALQTLFEEIAEASSAHSGVEAQGAFVALISMLLNSLSGGHSSQDDASFIEKTLSDPSLRHSAATETGYLHITFALHALLKPPAMIATAAYARTAATVPEEPSPALSHVVNLDKRVLGKLRYRWLSASFTAEGQRERKEWIEKSRPPHLDEDATWFRYSSLWELCRNVLSISRDEIIDEELAEFFDALDGGNSGACSFFRFLGLLEADPSRGATHPIRPRSRTNTRKQSLHSPFRGPPWRPPSGKDFGWRMIDDTPRSSVHPGDYF